MATAIIFNSSTVPYPAYMVNKECCIGIVQFIMQTTLEHAAAILEILLWTANVSVYSAIYLILELVYVL